MDPKGPPQFYLANPRETALLGFPAQYNSLRSRKQELQLAPLPKGAPKEASFRDVTNRWTHVEGCCQIGWGADARLVTLTC